MTAQRALVDLARRRTLRPLQVVYDDDDMRMQHDALPQIPYDPASVFLLETMISITVQTPDKIEDVWYVFLHFMYRRDDSLSLHLQAYCVPSHLCNTILG